MRIFQHPARKAAPARKSAGRIFFSSDAYFRVRMLALRARQLARDNGFIASPRAARLSRVRVGAAAARDVVVRGGRERVVTDCEFRRVEAARRFVLSRLAQRWAVGEEAGQGDGRRSRIEIRGYGRESTQRQADQGDEDRKSTRLNSSHLGIS